MAELRAGGMALIIDSATSEEIGRGVQAVSLIPVRGSFKSPHGRPSNNGGDIPAWLVTGNVVAKLGKESPQWAGNGWALYPPQYLMPIDGDDFSNEGERQKERSMPKSPAERKATQRQSKKRKHAICYQQI
ncbi:TPA: hypothetical protein ACH1T0_004686 [Klebsiella pneumoniae]|uniref:hypothetical protein n=1 Tax=Klebsiella pneumoniae TaxID=573 RepID=UPI000E2BDF97|nr:hypothetical protein [Klebsiella pneumoniae]EKS0266623.1 hypothetical protein [Klebsiella pneumoniae]EMB0545567.1 hypothetical protein [Klebsiella pneumoniae]SWT33554.1 Uncharacterised protein [Klebsiella pneumoniae]HBZ3639689.1 hypothetical protein [Klebsiella pneumoniae]HCL6411710.1 hypothetical protein [Klebsiella pneumoniae]